MTTAQLHATSDEVLSLYQLLDPETLANPYPLFHRLRSEDPVHWDPFLHAWVVTRYKDVVTVLHHYSAERTPTPEQLTAMGLESLNPIAQVMVKQMLDFLAEDIGGVERKPKSGAAPGVENFVARKAVGNFVDMVSLATLHL